MTDYRLPSSAQFPTSVDIQRVVNVSTRRSPFDQTIHRQFRSGDRWSAVATWDAVADDKRAELLAYFNRCRAGDHRALTPFWSKNNIGTFAGSPEVPVGGLAERASSVTFVNCTPSVTGWAVAGDLFTFGFGNTNPRNAHEVQETVDSDASGNAVVEFWPPVLTPVPAAIAPDPDGVIYQAWIVTDVVAHTDRAGLGNGSPLSSFSVSLLGDGQR